MMDERMFKDEAGAPMSEWDLKHRLPIDSPVGPEIQDSGTVYRINSTFMDVTEQPFMNRHFNAFVVLILLLLSGLTAVAVGVIWWSSGPVPDLFTGIFIFVLAACWLLYVRLALKCGRDEFFSLTRRPIRFNRREQKIYAVRRRRFFGSPDDGDVVWEAPWNSNSMFCLHSRVQMNETYYYIRHYTLDDSGNVLRVFAIGRAWEAGLLPLALAQWNYWCEYMNYGPTNMPKPALFFSERESVREALYSCLYCLFPCSSMAVRILFMPLAAFFAAIRFLSMATCREPKWSNEIEKKSFIAQDQFNFPSSDMPVGWEATSVARESGLWPHEEKHRVPAWRGETDPTRNAQLWAGDSSPVLTLAGGVR